MSVNKVEENTRPLANTLLALAIGMLVTDALASDAMTTQDIKEISAGWVCKWCPYPDKKESEGQVNAGAGYVSNDSYRHGDYTGLDEKGVYVIGDLQYGYRAPDQTYVDISGNELGTDARDLSVDARTGGVLSGNVTYSEIPKLNSDTARTPYRGGAHQQLPGSWVTGATTQTMPQLANSLRDVNIYTQRETFSLAASYQQNEALSYQVEFQRNTREGKRTVGLVLGAVQAVAILAVPVDHVTDQGELKVNYSKRNWQTSVSYQFSLFQNDKKAVRWENAFSVPASVTEGQAALEPDNSAHKINFAGLYHWSSSSSANLFVSMGQMKQDDRYLPYTVNGSLTPFALPTNSLDGKINTFDAAVNYYKRINEQLNIEAGFLHNEQDNDTARNTYDYINTDTSQSVNSRANFPYSFRKIQYRVIGRYQLQKQKVAVKLNRQEMDRTYQEVENTTENSLNLSYSNDMLENTNILVRGARSDRDGDEYQPVTEIVPPENPLLRKYNLADRERDQLGVTVNYSPRIKWQLAFYFDAYKDQYSESDLGLLESIQKDYGVSLYHQYDRNISLEVDYSMSDIESTQAGSQSFSTPTWYAVNEDQVNVIHLAVNYDIIPDTLKMIFEYGYAKSEGDIKVSTDTPLPVISSKRHTFTLSGEYILKKNAAIHAFYRYEDYDESDWAIDDVNPDTLSNVLSTGEVSPSYSIGVLGVSYRYIF